MSKEFEGVVVIASSLKAHISSPGPLSYNEVAGLLRGSASDWLQLHLGKPCAQDDATVTDPDVVRPKDLASYLRFRVNTLREAGQIDRSWQVFVSLINGRFVFEVHDPHGIPTGASHEEESR